MWLHSTSQPWSIRARAASASRAGFDQAFTHTTRIFMDGSTDQAPRITVLMAWITSGTGKVAT